MIRISERAEYYRSVALGIAVAVAISAVAVLAWWQQIKHGIVW